MTGRYVAEKSERTLTCPRCLHKVSAVVNNENGEATFTCPHCGYHGSVTAGESKEGRRMPDGTDVQRLLTAAAKATTLHESQRLVAEAEELRSQLYAQATAAREVDLANAIVEDHLRPVAVYEHHSTATDWIGDLVTTSNLHTAAQDAQARGSVWFTKLPIEVKADFTEFAEQARGMARRIAGAHGEQAPAVEEAFLNHVAALHTQHVALNPAVFSTNAPQPYEGLPLPETSSERAVNIQQLESPNPSQDLTPVNDPGLGQADTQVERTNNGEMGGSTTRTMDLGQDKQASRHTARKENTMQHAQCPTCGGHGRVAVRQAPLPSIEQIIRQGVSGLDQIDQTVDPHDNGPAPTPYPADVAFPWTMAEDGNPQQRTMAETEQQLAQREQMKGASLKEQVARLAAQEAYRRVLAGYDDSGWAGDMGQTPPTPGQQDGGNPPGVNLGMPDPVYGEGGDNGNQPLRPYGADEANDYVNNPGMNYQPGQPTQADTQINPTSVPGGGGPGFPDDGVGRTPGGKMSAKVADDPEIQRALAFVRQRRALLEQG